MDSYIKFLTIEGFFGPPIYPKIGRHLCSLGFNFVHILPFLSSVSSSMPLKFVRSCESFSTKYPIANKWSFTTMPSQMSSEMGCFSINFVAARNMTNMLLFSRFSIRIISVGDKNMVLKNFHSL